jgi:hypothetical protein
LELTDDHGLATAAEDRAITFLAAVQNPGARACLERCELAAAEALRPIGYERGVG